VLAKTRPYKNKESLERYSEAGFVKILEWVNGSKEMEEDHCKYKPNQNRENKAAEKIYGTRAEFLCGCIGMQCFNL